MPMKPEDTQFSAVDIWVCIDLSILAIYMAWELGTTSSCHTSSAGGRFREGQGEVKEEEEEEENL